MQNTPAIAGVFCFGYKTILPVLFPAKVLQIVMYLIA
jgi:hypothetical protein